MSRLTERMDNEAVLIDEEGVVRCGSVCDEHDNCYTCPLQKAFTKLADYEDKEEQGLLIELPVAEGAEVYVVDYIYECKHDFECPLTYDKYKCEEEVHCEHQYKQYRVHEAKFNFMMLRKIGETVFLTRSEAEEALAKMGGK